MKGSIELPGHNGGANWGSSAINPARGMFFVVSKELPTFLAIVSPSAPTRGGGGGRGRGAPAAARGGEVPGGPEGGRGALAPGSVPLASPPPPPPPPPPP